MVWGWGGCRPEEATPRGPTHIQRTLVLRAGPLARVQESRADGESTAFEVVTRVHGESLSQQNAHWLLSQTLAYLTQLEALGSARRIAGETERWAA